MKKALLAILALAPAVLFGQAADNVQDGVVGMLSFNEGKILSLAEAIPADKYDWRPEEGVRSISESLAHMAAANYFFFISAGAELPEGVNPMAMEAELKEKEAVIAAVKKSFSFAKEQIQAIEDDQLTDPVEFPFEGEFNKQNAILICMDHAAEHMGQLIAYARMNGITPPWSVSE